MVGTANALLVIASQSHGGKVMKAFQMKKAGLLVSVFFAGSTVFASAQDVPALATLASHLRVAALQERIKNQRERIDQGVVNKRITADQAKDCYDLLDSVEKQTQAEVFADGSKNMCQEEYEAYNTYLDANSDLVGEQKQSEYRYVYEPFHTQLASLK
jgi:hypothetical protein